MMRRVIGTRPPTFIVYEFALLITSLPATGPCVPLRKLLCPLDRHDAAARTRCARGWLQVNSRSRLHLNGGSLGSFPIRNYASNFKQAWLGYNLCMGDFRCIIMLRFRANILMIPMVITKRLLLPMILLAITMSVMMLTAIILNYKSDDNIERDGLWPCWWLMTIVITIALIMNVITMMPTEKLWWWWV